jgi:glycosyltransferase involved in cell wall biosynthesis
MTLNICHLISSLDVGGAETSLLRLLSVMNRSRFHSSVVSMVEAGPIGESIRQLGVPVSSLHLRRGAVSLAGLLELTRRLRNETPDILLTWLYHSDLLGLLAGRLAGVPIIVWNLRASDMDMSRYRKLSAWTIRLCSRLSRMPSAVIANSSSGKAYHGSIGYRPRIFAVIPNGIDCARFKPDAVVREHVRKSFELGPGDVVIGLVARFDPMKDHDNFLAAARLVAQTDDSVRFILAGKDINKRNGHLISYLAKQPLAGKVRLLDERDDIPALLQAFDVACSSSRSEAFPNTIAEAMACAVPCVATAVGDSAEIIGDTGILVPPADSQALAGGLLRAIALGTSRRRELGCAARERIISNFSLERCVGRYEAFLSRLAKNACVAEAQG